MTLPTKSDGDEFFDAEYNEMARHVNEHANVKDFGAVGDGSTDDTAAIQAAVTAGRVVYFGGRDLNYRVTGTITVPSERTIRGDGAKITQGTANTEIFNAESKSDIEVSGIHFVGVGTDFFESDSRRAVAIYCGTSGSRINVRDCTFENFGYTSVRFRDNTECEFTRNTIIGPGTGVLSSNGGRCYGVLVDYFCDGVVIADCQIRDCAVGVRVNGSSNVLMANIVVRDILGQHGFYVGAGGSNLAIIGCTLTDIEFIGIKVQSDDTLPLDTVNVTIVGNTVTRCGQAGIQTHQSAPGQTQRIRNVTVVGNTVTDSDQDGINATGVRGGVYAHNVITDVAREGISFSDFEDVRIVGNVISEVGNYGIRSILASARVTIAGNMIKNPGLVAGVNNFGLRLNGVLNEYFNIRDNEVVDENGNMEYGVFCVESVQPTFRVTGNRVVGATVSGARFKNPTETMDAYRGNSWDGALAPVSDDPLPPSVASAASIVLPQGWDLVTITGVTGITSIAVSGQSNRRVTLRFVDVVTVTDGGNLKLAGNFVSSADDTLTLVSDGITWYEVCRSVN